MKRLILVVLMFVIILSSCKNSVTYSFEIPKLDGFSVYDYISSENFEFMRIGEVAIAPQIKSVRYKTVNDTTYTVYAIYISAYAIQETENVFIKDISISINDDSFKLEKRSFPLELTLESDSNNKFFEDNLIVAEFCDENILESINDDFSLIVSLEYDYMEEVLIKEISFDLAIESYKRPIMR